MNPERPGPMDDTVLDLQLKHRSTSIWQGEVRFIFLLILLERIDLLLFLILSP